MNREAYAWEKRKDPSLLIDQVGDLASERLIRLLACGIIRTLPVNQKRDTIWELLPNYGWTIDDPEEVDLSSDARRIVEIVEQYCEKKTSRKKWNTILDGSCDALKSVATGLANFRWYEAKPSGDLKTSIAYLLMAGAMKRPGRITTLGERKVITHWIFYLACEQIRKSNAPPICFEFDLGLCQIIRDILGNPYLPATIDERHKSSSVISIARHIYTSREFERMPILGDALEDAGCDHEVILNHCRDDALHTRGCWVVDQILGKKREVKVIATQKSSAP